MATTPSQHEVIKFGVFEVDLATGEVRKAGMKQKLAGQPFQVLQALLERPQEIVTREELRERLWPGNTFVDYELALKKAVNRLREVLGDSAENPHYIETVPRRGYRFIASLNGAHMPSMFNSPVGGVEAAAKPTAGTQVREKPQTKRSGLKYSILTGAVLVSAAFLGYPLTLRLLPPRVTRFVQVTGDAQGKTASYVHELPSSLVSDGSRLYFMEGPVGSTRLAQVSAIGGETTLFAAPFRIRRLLDVSPNRRDLLVLSSDQLVQMEYPMMVLPLPAGSPHRLGDILAHDASWSRDGDRIVYANGHDLYVAKSDGSEPRKLTTVPGTAWWPRWSPDGSVVRFTVLEAQGWRRLWEVSTDSGGLHPLFPERNVALGGQCCGNWTADGSYFVFESVPPPGGMSQVWSLREGRGFLKKARALTQLTTGPMSMVAPLPSADGKKIFAVAVQPRGQLVRYNGRSRQFVPFLSGISADGVDFSKDGQWVTYVLFPERTLWRSKADGSERLQLTLPPMKVSLPRWSPDGKRIAFLGQAAGKPVKIYIVSADGGTSKQAIPGELNEGEASWSPDGNSLAFGPLWWLEGSAAIRVLDLKTGQITTLPDSEGLFSARWSPDGRQLVALRADATQTLMLFDFEGRKWEELAKSAAYPNWSRDGSCIYFEDPYTNEPALYRVLISDRKVEELATLDPRILSWAIVGKWMGLAPDDSPLVLRDTSVEEIYALDLER
jgi:Tol biopolymer transport system component/DNA-binding winged helix-turn-helix (wHTH) protein